MRSEVTAAGYVQTRPFRHVTTRSLVDMYQRLRGICLLDNVALMSALQVPPECLCLSVRLHGVNCHKTVMLILIF
jgi:hypothetical protein